MVIIEKIRDIEGYSQDLREYFNSILNGRILSIDIIKANDKEILAAIPNGIPDSRRGLLFVNNLCSWFCIGESRECVFERPYMQMCLILDDNNKFYINYSRFRYPLSFTRPKYHRYGKLSGVNTIDGRTIDPDYYFENHQGERILYICGVLGIDSFGNERLCAKFAKEEIDPIHLRRYILMAQYISIKEFLKDPISYSYIPMSNMTCEIDGQLYYKYDVPHHPLMNELAQKIFKEEFYDAFNEKYKFILSELEYFNSHFKQKSPLRT